MMEQRWPGQMADGQASGVHGGGAGRKTETLGSAWPPEKKPQERASSHQPKEGGSQVGGPVSSIRCSRGPGSVRAGGCLRMDLVRVGIAEADGTRLRQSGGDSEDHPRWATLSRNVALHQSRGNS